MAAATGEGATPAGQEGGVDVDDAVTGEVEDGAGEDASVGGNDDEVGLGGGEPGDGLRGAQGVRLEDGDAEAFGLDCGGGGAHATAASGAAVGLRDDEAQVVALSGERAERGQRELGGAHEDCADLLGLHRGVRSTASPLAAPVRGGGVPLALGDGEEATGVDVAREGRRGARR